MQLLHEFLCHFFPTRTIFGRKPSVPFRVLKRVTIPHAVFDREHIVATLNQNQSSLLLFQTTITMTLYCLSERVDPAMLYQKFYVSPCNVQACPRAARFSYHLVSAVNKSVKVNTMRSLHVLYNCHVLLLTWAVVAVSSLIQR